MVGNPESQPKWLPFDSVRPKGHGFSNARAQSPEISTRKLSQPRPGHAPARRRRPQGFPFATLVLIQVGSGYCLAGCLVTLAGAFAGFGVVALAACSKGISLPLSST